MITDKLLFASVMVVCVIFFFSPFTFQGGPGDNGPTARSGSLVS